MSTWRVTTESFDRSTFALRIVREVAACAFGVSHSRLFFSTPDGFEVARFMSRKIYVGNLPWSTTSADLEAMFAEHGPVSSAEVISDRETGRSRGFGFVEMESEEGMQAAVNALNGHEMNGRPLTVNEARERTPRSGGGGWRWRRRRSWLRWWRRRWSRLRRWRRWRRRWPWWLRRSILEICHYNLSKSSIKNLYESGGFSFETVPRAIRNEQVCFFC